MRSLLLAAVFAPAAVAPSLARGLNPQTTNAQLSSTPTDDPTVFASPVQLDNGPTSNLTAPKSITNDTASPPPPPPSPISWQSALWGLIAVSLNAQTQRSAADHFPSSDSLSPARSSPFVCLADIVIAVIWLLRGWKAGLGVRGALGWYRKEMGLLRERGDRGLIQVFCGKSCWPRILYKTA